MGVDFLSFVVFECFLLNHSHIRAFKQLLKAISQSVNQKNAAQIGGIFYCLNILVVEKMKDGCSFIPNRPLGFMAD